MEDNDYFYASTDWGDLLIAYNGNFIYYDDTTTSGGFKIGNPTTYYNGKHWDFTWEHGRQLATMFDGTATWTNTYNADGLRTSRTNRTTTYNYYYDGSQLVNVTGTNGNIWIFYDGNRPVIIKYGDTATYHYELNLQGDVIAILDSDGTRVVEYTYDAWGKILSISGSKKDDLGQANPLRYRGYVYDHETQLYYLQSRYYDPQTHRFINSDTHITTGQGVLDNNVFVYCGNNPITRADISGEAWETIIDLISLIVSACDVIENPSDGGAWFGLVLDAVDLIPFITGAGEAYKAYRLTDKAVDGFGNLSKAKQFGINGYNTLRKALAGTGLEAHHIIEKRLVGHLDIDINNMLSIAVTKDEHQAFTNAWRAAFPYGMDYSTLTRQDIWSVAQDIYEDYPEVLEAAEQILFN